MASQITSAMVGFCIDLVKVSFHTGLRDRLKNTLKPMKWNIFHFSLDPLPPLRSEIPSYFWLHSMMVNTSMKPFFFWKSEKVTMKSPTPPPPPSEKYFTSFPSRYFWDGPLERRKTKIIERYECLQKCSLSSTGIEHISANYPPVNRKNNFCVMKDKHSFAD